MNFIGGHLLQEVRATTSSIILAINAGWLAIKCTKLVLMYCHTSTNSIILATQAGRQ